MFIVFLQYFLTLNERQFVFCLYFVIELLIINLKLCSNGVTYFWKQTYLVKMVQ